MAISSETRAKMSASAKAAKARLKADPVAYQQFRERTANAVKKQWAEEDQSQRVANMSKARQEQVAAESAEERKKYGWMNRPDVTPEQKRAIWENSLKKWYDAATPEQLAAMITKRNEAIANCTIQHGKLFDNSLPTDHPLNIWAKEQKTFKVDFDEVFGVE